LLNLREDCRRAFRSEYVNTDAAGGGLATAFALGSNVLTFTVYVPLSFVKAINNGKKVFGLGYGQMLDSKCLLKASSDAFKAANAALSTTKYYVTFFPLWETGHPHFIGPMMMARRLVNAKSDTITTESGLVVSLEQMVAESTTLLDKMKVTVGDTVMVNDTAPADIERAYLESAGVGSSGPESEIQLARTPVYVFGDTEFSAARVGKVEAVQAALTEEWNARAVYFPLLTTAQVFDLVAAEAAKLPPKQQILFVSAAVYDGVDANAPQLPFSGMVGFTSDQPEFYENAGLACESGGRPYVRIPPHLARQYGRRIVDAMKPSQDFPKGDTGTVRGIREEAAWKIPGFIVDASGTAYVSRVASDVANILDAAAKEQEQQQNQVSSLVAQLQGSKGKAGAQPGR
ncbi:MAG: hypothetical protein ACXU86_11825, partial [Archangium sp.]